MVGSTISHYKVLEKLGEGGMGVVYRAEDTRLKRTVALKFLPPELTRDPVAKQRFIHEAQAASALQHNNICVVHDVDETNEGQMFIVMELYEGEALSKKVERGPLKIDEAVEIAIQVAQGLQEAHSHEIVHRDIKPANVLTTSSGVVKIVDFGLAKLAGGTVLTKSGSAVGTAAYMSPEQARGERVDARTDVWSLGVLIYEMATGQRPFKGEYDNALMYSILNAQPEPMTGLRTDIPLDLERIAVKCLAKDPGERYQHVDEVLVDLVRLRTDSKKKGATSEELHSRSKPRKSLKHVMWSVSLSLAVIIILAGYFLSIWTPSNPTHSSEWQNSIAVLPLRNVSSDPEQEYFCDGMTEQLITNLSNLPGLKVIASQSVMRLRDSEKSPKEIGAELGVAYVLQGSIRRSGGMIRTAVQLIRAEDGSHVWAEDYDRDVKDVFSVQDDVSESIAKKLLERLSDKEQSAIKMTRAADPEAYDLYLRASYLLHRYERTFQFDDYRNAEVMFKKALDRDPGHVPSMIDLADLYGTYLDFAQTLTEEERNTITVLQKQYAADALRLDPHSPGAYLVQLPFMQLEYTKKALELNPNHVGALLNYCFILRTNGLLHQSLEYFDRVQALNPLHPWVYTGRGLSYWYLGETDKAIDDYERALQIEPNEYWTHVWYLDALICSKRIDQADEWLKRCQIKWPSGSGVYDLIAREAWLFAAREGKDAALRTFERRTQKNNINDQIVLYSLLGMKDEGIALLGRQQKSKANDLKSSRYLMLAHWPALDGLRDDVRFKEILAKEKEKHALVLKHYGM
ncbi:MAG: protein kinase [Bacteroidota bacterium]